MDNNAEELGKKLLLDLLPKGLIAAASVVTFAAYSRAAPALKAIFEFVVSIID